MSNGQLNRRDFLKLAGLTAAYGAGCSRIAGTGSQAADTATPAANSNALRILQQTHFVPAYDEWFDKEYTVKWGKENGIQVEVEHTPFANIYARAAGAAAARSGHDIFGFVSPPSAFENEVIDVTDVIEEIQAKAGPMLGMMKNGAYNPRTKKWFGVPEFWAVDPVLWRKDLWEEAEPGSKPDTWDDVLRVGRKLKANGHPIGIGMSTELDSNCALRAILYGFGASVQDANARVIINSKETVEALKMGAAIFRETMTPEVLAWSASSNNAFIASGEGSLVMNAVSGVRAIEKKNPDLAKTVWLGIAPAGPVRRMAPANIMSVYVIWKYSPHIDQAKKFLVDLISEYSEAFPRSESYNMPAFPGSVPELKKLLSKDSVAVPADKYALQSEADAWSTNMGYPGISNAAITEVVDAYIIPKMFSLVAQGSLTAEDAARWAESAITPIFEKWRAKGMI